VTRDESTGTPVQSTDAERINPYNVLIDVHDYAIGRRVTPGREAALAGLSLAAAMVSWPSRQWPLMIHTAPQVDADIADATGQDRGEVRRWERWAARLFISRRPGADPDEVRTFRDRPRSGVDG